MARKPVGEANLGLFCTKTQLSLVRNVRGAVFPGRMATRPAKALGIHLGEALRRAAEARGMRAEDVTDDDDLTEIGAIYHGMTAREHRPPGYRLVRLDDAQGEWTVWCELMSANHLTFSVAGTGLDFVAEAERLRTFVDGLDGDLGYASDPTLGYLTAQPMLLGTGFRIRSMVHVGGLAHFGYLRELCNAADAKGAMVELDRTDVTPPGALVIIFNRFSLGFGVREIAERFRAFLVRVSEQETEARWRLFRDEPFVFLDLLTRAKAVLKTALLMSEQEALDLLSDLRLGLTTGAISARKVDPLAPHWFDDATDRVFFRAHGRALRRKHVLPHDVDADPSLRDEALRAEWLRPLANFAFSRELIERADEQ